MTTVELRLDSKEIDIVLNSLEICRTYNVLSQIYDVIKLYPILLEDLDKNVSDLDRSNNEKLSEARLQALGYKIEDIGDKIAKAQAEKSKS